MNSPLKKVIQSKRKTIFWMHNVSQTASYEITLVHLSAPPSASPDFLKIVSLVLYLLTDEAWFLKNIFWLDFEPSGSKSGPK